MDKNLVIFDIVTTGLAVLQDEILEFAAQRVCDGKIQESCHFFVLPEQEITDEMLGLVGWKAEELAAAVPLSEHSREIQDLFADAVLVGHQAKALLSVLEKKLKINFQQTIWDTLELSRIFFPTFHDYQLPYLTEKLSLQGEETPQGSRSENNVRLIGKLLEACWSKGMDFDLSFYQQAKVFLEGWSGRGFIDEIYKETGRRFPDRQIRTDFVLAPVAEGLFAVKNAEKEMTVTKEWIIHCFLPGGILERRLSHYESRPGQVEMAAQIVAGLEASEHVVVEAGTGTGKSFAYLIPSLWSAKKTGQKVVVATHTIPLQEQLIKKDIPVLKKVLPFSFKAALLKGKGNYCCLRKLQGVIASPDFSWPEQKLACLSVMVWIRETQTGDLQELSKVPGLSRIWPNFNADNEACIPAKCPKSGVCFLLRARKRAEEADLVIVNHSLLFADIKTDYKVLPEYHQLVIDEAHQIYQTALEHLGSDISLERVVRIMDDIHKISDLNTHGRLKQAWQISSGAWEILRQCLQQIPESCNLVLEQARELFQSLELLISGTRTFRFVSGHMTQDWWQGLAVQIENLSGRLKALAAVLESMVKVLKGESGDELEELQYVIEGQQREVQELLNTLCLSLSIDDPQQVTWLEQGARLHLKTSPIEISDVLQERLFSHADAVVLTSATLSIADSFAHFLRDMGLPETTKTTRVDSPFDYDRQMQLFVVRKGLDLQEREEDQVRGLAEFITEVAKRMQGRTLVLFTAHTLLRSTYAAVHSRLAQIGIETLAQGFHGERTAMLEAFKRNPRSVLLGANSFWEGIDIPGDALSCVILIKLPFWPPSLPLLEARSEYFASLGRNPFQELSLPEAVIRFKQGFGRLIRSQGDRGIVILWDDRVISKYYGRLFLNSLPVKTHVRGDRELILRKIEEWRPTNTTGGVKAE